MFLLCEAMQYNYSTHILYIYIIILIHEVQQVCVTQLRHAHVKEGGFRPRTLVRYKRDRGTADGCFCRVLSRTLQSFEDCLDLLNCLLSLCGKDNFATAW